MILLADESVSGAIIARLRADGHAVESIRETVPGSPDTAVLARANAIPAVLLTEDKDFGELVYRLHSAHPGVLLIRLGGVPRSERAERVADLVRDHAVELPRAFTVISSRGVRIRPASPPSAADQSASPSE